MAIYDQVLGAGFWVVRECSFHVQTKMDISYCGYATGFPRCGHIIIYMQMCMRVSVHVCLCSYIIVISVVA